MAERNSTAQALGALTAQVEAIQHLIEQDRRDRKETDEKAEKHRQEIAGRVSDIATAQRDLERRVRKIEPMADLVAGTKAKFAGGVIVLGFIGGVALTLFSLFKDRITQLLSGG